MVLFLELLSVVLLAVPDKRGIFFFNEEEGRSKVRLHLLKLGSSSCNLCL